MKPIKPIRPASTRGGVNDLAKTPRTIVDYAKALPTAPTMPNPAAIPVLPKGRR